MVGYKTQKNNLALDMITQKRKKYKTLKLEGFESALMKNKGCNKIANKEFEMVRTEAIFRLPRI